MKDGITSNVFGVLGRILFFLVYYILLICAGIALLGAAAYITWNWTLHIWSIFSELGLYGILLMGLAYFFLWGVAIFFAIYLIKPLFAFSRNENPDRVEVFEHEAPVLFQCLKEMSKEVGCKMPKHVYLTADVNACVFYNTSFWSIFFPVRKNMEIGLGLFQATSKVEVMSVIGHELGHFAQGSMKVGSTVYIVNSIIHNLVYAQDFYEKWLYNMTHKEETNWLRKLGTIIRILTNWVKLLNLRVYRWVQKSYLRLSRQMEFDADNVACRVAGKEAFISSQCKLEITSGFHNAYEHFIYNLLNEGKTIRDYWEGYFIVKEVVAQEYLYTFDYRSLLEKRYTLTNHTNRVAVYNVWDTHPSRSQRIENASRSSYHTSSERIDSLSMIPEEIRKKVGDYRLSQFTNGRIKLEEISDDDFRNWVRLQVDHYFIPLPLRPFFDRNIIEFENSSSEDKTVENPFTHAAADLLYEYETALQDWSALNAFKDGNVDLDSVTYDGEIYTKKNVPLEQHRQYLDELHFKARDIDASVFRFLRAKTSNRNRLEYAYLCYFTSAHVLPGFEHALEYRASLVSQWNEYNRDLYDFSTFLSYVNSLLRTIRRYIAEKVDWAILASVVNEENLSIMKNFSLEGDIAVYQGVAKVDSSLAVLDHFYNAYVYMSQVSKNLIVQETKKILSSIEDPGDSFINYKDPPSNEGKASKDRGLKEDPVKAEKSHKHKEDVEEEVLESKS